MRIIEKINILGIEFNNLSQKEAVSYIFSKYDATGKCSIVTANPEIVMHATRDREYKKNIKNSDLIVADGIGIILASKIFKRPLKERVAGLDLTMELLKVANAKKLSIFLLGAKEEVVKKTAEVIKNDFKDIKIAGYHNGYFDINDNEIYSMVNSASPDIVFVATGFPKQEVWIKNYHDNYQVSIAIGVGGSFDVLSGESKRAPLWVMKLNLEWAYRLIKEPKRIVRMIDLPKFMLRVLKEKYFYERR